MISYWKVLIVSGRVDRPCQTDSGGGYVVCRSRDFLTWRILTGKTWGRPMANRRPETLGEFVRRIREEKGLSLADESKASARFGKKIAASYISRIENEPTRKITTHRLTALAKGLGVPAAECSCVRLVFSDPLRHPPMSFTWLQGLGSCRRSERLMS